MYDHTFWYYLRYISSPNYILPFKSDKIFFVIIKTMFGNEFRRSQVLNKLLKGKNCTQIIFF